MLVYHPATGDFHHHDSSNGLNNPIATNFVVTLQVLRSFENAKVGEAKCPQQTNGDDCGVHVLMSTQELAGGNVPNSAEAMRTLVREAYLKKTSENKV